MDGQNNLKYCFSSNIVQYTVCGSFANGIENDWSRHEIKKLPYLLF